MYNLLRIFLLLPHANGQAKVMFSVVSVQREGHCTGSDPHSNKFVKFSFYFSRVFNVVLYLLQVYTTNESIEFREKKRNFKIISFKVSYILFRFRKF